MGLLDGYATRPRGLLDDPDPITRMWHNLPDQGGGNVVPRPTVQSEAQYLMREMRGEVPSMAVNVVRGFTEGPATIRAFHGSPHRFDRFDMSRIGTGEGAQAYGHGLYFAGNEAVARSYRPVADQTVKIGRQPVLRELNAAAARGDEAAQLALEVAHRDGTITGTLSTLAERARWRPEYKAASDWFTQNLDRFRQGQTPRGAMYEVNLNTTPDRLLDWDAPLSQQPAAVREALGETLRWQRPAREAMDRHRASYGEPTGAHAYNAIEGVVPRGQGAQFAAEELRANGIDGIQYLDAGSRAAGQGSRNYVMFDDRLIDIVRRYGLAPLLFGGGAGLLAEQPAGGLLDQ